MVSSLTPREVDRKIVELVAHARKEYDIPEGCDGETACGKLGLELDRAPLPPGTSGMISGNRVVVDQNVRWAPRTEFTIYHEITHNLIEEDGELTEHYTALLRNDDAAFKQEMERCCDKGAAEFLMPRIRIAEMVRAEAFSVDLIGTIAERHGASLIASALQLAHCAPVECYVVLCSQGPVPRSRPRRHGLYVDYAGASPTRRYPLARFSPISGDHILAHAWKDRDFAEGASSVPFRSGAFMPCHCEAKPVGPFVAGILSFGIAAVPRGQMSFDM